MTDEESCALIGGAIDSMMFTFDDLIKLDDSLETLGFDDRAIERLAEIAFLINERQENIGARRLHTVLEKLLEKLSFEAPDKSGLSLMVDRAMVDAQLGDAVQDPDLSRYIL